MTVSDAPGTGLYTSSLATVTNLGSGTGRVTGNAPGTATVTYTVPSGCMATSIFTVNPLPDAISGAGGHICTGATAIFTDGTPGGTWSTSATSAVTIGSTSGVLTGVSAGTGYVTYTLTSTSCKVDTSEMIYNMPSAITGAASLFIGSPITLNDALSGGAWSSSNAGVATIGAGTGYVTGVSVGSATITYNNGGACYVTKKLTVMPSLTGHKTANDPGTNEGADDNQVRVSPNPGD
jgi:uncharacterized protein YjdB